MMTPRERVMTTLNHQLPDRVPFSWGFGPTAEMGQTLEVSLAAQGIDWSRLRALTEDINYVTPVYHGPALLPGTDIWGIHRKVVSYGDGGYEEIDRYPLAEIEDPDALASYPWPDPTVYDDTGIRAAVAQTDPYRLRAKKLTGGNPFETYCWMTGLETALMNLMTEPAVVMAALQHITDFYVARLQRVLVQAGDLIDIVFFADDLGSQQGLLISRELYREVLQPCHRRLADTVRCVAPHAKVMLHSDGAVFAVLPDLIEAGIDVFEAVQTDATGMEPAQLKTAFGDRLSFHGAISVQSLLPHGTPAQVMQVCRELVEILGGSGGYIAAPSHAIQAGTPVDNILAMLCAILGESEYQQVLSLAAIR